jgi:hypothetical protein
MTFAWILNTASLFAMTAGSLLFFLGLWESPRAHEDKISPKELIAVLRRRRLLALGGGLLSLWFVVQYLSVIIL